MALGSLPFLVSNPVTPWQSLGLSFANTLNVFGFRKDYFDPHLIDNPSATLKILAAVQTMLGTISFFSSA